MTCIDIQQNQWSGQTWQQRHSSPTMQRDDWNLLHRLQSKASCLLLPMSCSALVTMYVTSWITYLDLGPC